jgi:ferredoxin
MSYTVTANQDLCIASMQCSAVAAAIFSHGEDGIVVVTDESPLETLRDSVEYAARICPSGAIEIRAS